MLKRPCPAIIRGTHPCYCSPIRPWTGFQHLRRGVATTATNRSSPSRIHILGLGSIGTFTAHTLGEISSRSPITLLVHRESLVDDYTRRGGKFTLETREGELIEQSGYDFEHTAPSNSPSPEFLTQEHLSYAEDRIHHLIVCVKSTQTVTALRPLLPRLTHESSITFLQNGAGMIEDVNEILWPSPKERPSYITGVISHGVTLKGPFDIKHTGPAATYLGPVPRDNGSNLTTSASSTFLLDALPRAPRLNCQSYGWPDILQRQLEKIAVNAFSNPLTALADSTVEYLFSIPKVRSALMQEISSVILALPELAGVPGVQERFSAQRLEATVMEVIVQNRSTTCSMVWDMRARRETEIRYINGYWARRGREVGVATPINDEIVDKIHAMTKKRQKDLSE